MIAKLFHKDGSKSEMKIKRVFDVLKYKTKLGKTKIFVLVSNTEDVAIYKEDNELWL
jgi:hypothetical protein